MCFLRTIKKKIYVRHHFTKRFTLHLHVALLEIKDSRKRKKERKREGDCGREGGGGGRKKGRKGVRKEASKNTGKQTNKQARNKPEIDAQSTSNSLYHKKNVRGLIKPIAPTRFRYKVMKRWT